VALSEALHWYPTATCAVVTDISRDGMLSGSDVEGLRAAGTISPLPLIASGGIGTLDDISALLNIVGVSGVITGKAIYENRFTVVEAIAAANARKQ
jgi:phosphoribosylformimino-5-aminoimidazole carboxamide ribonucleotide (ProFAR) isomerase